jgi:hypothetical protein
LVEFRLELPVVARAAGWLPENAKEDRRAADIEVGRVGSTQQASDFDWIDCPIRREIPRRSQYGRHLEFLADLGHRPMVAGGELPD